MTLLSHAELDVLRGVGDPPADAVAAVLGDRIWTLNAALHPVHRNRDRLATALPDPARDFFGDHVTVPSWLDRGRALRAQRMARRHLLHITVALFCASLPTSYGAARGARVLSATGRLGGDVVRRVNETAQFVLDVLDERAFDPDGAALCSIQKVRLMHAAVRLHLTARGLAEGETPINQEDLLGTLFCFSVVVIRSLRLLGAPLGDDDAGDYYHLWRAVGAMLGIREDLLPPDLPAACDLSDRIAGRQLAGSEHGRQLMATLLASMEAHVPGWPGGPRTLVRHLVGDRLADDLGVPRDGSYVAPFALLRWLPRRATASVTSLVLRSSRALGRPLLDGVVALRLEGRPTSFAMPTTL